MGVIKWKPVKTFWKWDTLSQNSTINKVSAHLVHLIKYRSRNRHWNLLSGQCVSSWWPLVQYLTNCAVIYIYIYIIPKYLADGFHNSHLDLKLIAEGMAYGGLPFPDTSCPVPDVYIYYVSDMINVLDNVSTFIHLLWMFLPTDILFWTNISTFIHLLWMFLPTDILLEQPIGYYTMGLLFIRFTY